LKGEDRNSIPLQSLPRPAGQRVSIREISGDDEETIKMNPRMPRLTGKKVEKALIQAGWYLHHSRGSHFYYR
jgi:hypothetical protein